MYMTVPFTGNEEQNVLLPILQLHTEKICREIRYNAEAYFIVLVVAYIIAIHVLVHV